MAIHLDLNGCDFDAENCKKSRYVVYLCLLFPIGQQTPAFNGGKRFFHFSKSPLSELEPRPSDNDERILKVSNHDIGIHLKAAGISFTYISTLKLPHTYLT